MKLSAYWWEGRKNFGDQLTGWLLEQITGVQAVQSAAPPRLISIGSVLSHARQNDIVWGSGLRTNDQKPASSLDIRAVRGPLTHQIMQKYYPLLPKVYGDPALLFPRFYHPNIKCYPGVTVIPHIYDQWLVGGDRRISVESPPLEVVDAIASSEVIITSSLHALIIAEAYRIPVIVVRNQNHMKREPHFKFIDYFASTGRKDCSLFDVSFKTALKYVTCIPSPSFPDLDFLLSAFPKDRLTDLLIHGRS